GEVAGSGSRPRIASGKVRVIDREFTADARALADFEAFLKERKLKYTPEDLQANRQAIERSITEEVLRQVFGEKEARWRMLAWDPQVQKALSLVSRSELLLRDPQKFI